MDNMRIISVQLKELRKMKKLTQEELSDLSGYSRDTIIKIEGNKIKNITLGTLDKIFSSLGMKINISLIPIN